MLSIEDNKMLMQVGPGTPMGNLMRRYWQPIAAVQELEERPTKQVRIMGEDLVLYKDKSGTYGLMDLHCPHRRADMSYGMVEDCGLRCNYHGWAFDEKGNCISQPFEEIAHPDANYKDRIKIKAYEVRAKAGLLFAYLGPDPAPELWDWDTYHQTGFKQVVFAQINCNWLQCAENNIDPVHFEWLHSNWSQDIQGVRDPKAKPVPTHLQVGFDEFEWGFFYRRVLEGDDKWTTGRVAIMPNLFMPGAHFEWRIPVDDDNTLLICWICDKIPGDEPFEQETIPYWWTPIVDAKTGRWVNSHVINQDAIAWVGQGIQSDRENEHLGESDRGVIMFRQRLLQDIKIVEDGGDPKGVLRDPSRNYKISLKPTELQFANAPVEGGPQFAPGRDPEIAAAQTEQRQRAIAARGGAPRPTSTTLLFGQPASVAEEYQRIVNERQAALTPA